MMILTLVDVREEFYHSVFDVKQSQYMDGKESTIRPHMIQRMQFELQKLISFDLNKVLCQKIGFDLL